MNPRITLTVNGGRLDGKEYTFADRKTYIIGRGPDCDLQMPCAEEFQTVSRHHCLLCVDPPTVRLRDLGSRNGTVVNGEQIGSPKYWPLPEDSAVRPFAEHELKDGDEFKVGGTVFKVHVSERPEEVHESEVRVEQGKELCAYE
jgi:pSer/pThr/pTyr-binding forkhead associated (FHA) protein